MITAPRRLLILAHTPYHLLMAEALLACLKPEDARLVVIEDFPDARALVAALQTVGTFRCCSRIDVFSGFATKGGLPAYTRRAVVTAQQLRRCWQQSQPTHLALCHDYLYTARVLLQCARRTSTQTLLLEDGAEAYGSALFAPKSVVQRVALAGLFRVRWTQLPHLGASVPEATFYGTFPKERRPELRDRAAKVLSPEPLLQLDAAKVLAALPGVHGLELASQLVLLPHPEFLSKGQREAIQTALLEQLGDGMCLKAHPRQTSWEAWPQLARACVALVPSHLPAELLLLDVDPIDWTDREPD